MPNRIIVLSGREYELINILRGDEVSITNEVLIERAKELDAILTKEDQVVILKSTGEIPIELRETITLVLVDQDGTIGQVFWVSRWYLTNSSIRPWYEADRLVRRVPNDS